MALAVQHHADLGFSNSNNFTPASAYNAAGDTWIEASISAFSTPTSSCTIATFDTTLDLTQFRHDNAATAHRSANTGCVMPQALASHAGSHNFNFQGTLGGNFLDYQCRSGDGSIDSAVVDATGFVDDEQAPIFTGGVATPAPYTPSSTNALPLISYLSDNAFSSTLSAVGATCTMDQQSSLDSGVATFHCPLASPGSPTAAQINSSDSGFDLIITYALKPAAAAGGYVPYVPLPVAFYTSSESSRSSCTKSLLMMAALLAPPTLTLIGTTPYFTGGGTIYPFKSALASTTNVLMAGRFTGIKPDHVEYQTGGAGGFSIVGSEVIGSGIWMGVIPSLPKGDTSVVLRMSNSTTTSVTTLVSVAANIWIGGDSEGLMPNAGNVSASATPQKVRWLHPTLGWVDWDSTANFEQGAWAYFGNEITAGQGVPVFILNGAVAGSTYGTWVHGQTNFDNAAALVSKVNGGMTMIMMPNLGTNAARGGSGNTPSSVQSSIAATCADLRTYVDPTAPIFWPAIGQVDTNTGGGTLRTEMDAVRAGLSLAVGAGTVRYGQHIYDQVYALDGLHPDANDLAPWGRRLYLEVTDTVYGTSVGHGPRMVSVTTNAAKDTSIVTVSPAFTAASGAIPGFRATDNGSPLTLTGGNATLLSSTQVQVQTTTGAGGTLRVSFASGNDAVGATAALGAAETLPTGATVQRVLEFFLDVIPGNGQVPYQPAYQWAPILAQ